jgi:hypothetical protein
LIVATTILSDSRNEDEWRWEGFGRGVEERKCGRAKREEELWSGLNGATRREYGV